MKNRRLLSLTLLSIATATILFSCNNKNNSAKNTTDVEKEAKVVRVSHVVFEPVDQNVTFSATTESEIKNNIASAIPSRIRKIRVEIGDRVSRGQVLVELDKNNLLKQEVQINNLKTDLERYKSLIDVGGVSQQQIDQLELQLRVAQASYDNLKENTTLLSPISGIITARNYDEGDMPAQFPILTVESINPIKTVINISETYFPQIKKGMPVNVTIDSYGEENFSGTISLIYPTVDPKSHTFGTEIKINNANGKIKPGMYCRVKMNLGTNNRALVDDMAVMKQSGSNDRYVFIAKDGVAKYTKVELGIRVNDKYEIISGLNPGDQVIVQGASNLIDGTPIEIVD